jgi:hypothetical protein
MRQDVGAGPGERKADELGAVGDVVDQCRLARDQHIGSVVESIARVTSWFHSELDSRHS